MRLTPRPVSPKLGACHEITIPTAPLQSRLTRPLLSRDRKGAAGRIGTVISGQALPTRRALQERALLQFLERLAELLLGVHYNRAVPRNGFPERLSRAQQEPDPVLSGLYADVVATVEKHQRAVVRLRGRGRVRP